MGSGGEVGDAVGLRVQMRHEPAGGRHVNGVSVSRLFLRMASSCLGSSPLTRSCSSPWQPISCPAAAMARTASA
jgi:hypothetical protein